ncbi:hypothetical protein [Streptomyces collinus]|uniref:hypothetical protein n=1 Tax=Streptomyces collinus TaxID=42684 RepID=UPI00368E6CDE
MPNADHFFPMDDWRTFQYTPIFDRLVLERGDTPAQVRREAMRIERDLARVMTFNVAASAITLQQAQGLAFFPPSA